MNDLIFPLYLPLDLNQVVTNLRSQCSHFLGGIGVSLPGQPPLLFKKETAPSDDTPTEQQELVQKLLSNIDQNPQQQNRLQFFDPEKQELWFTCGDGKNPSVLISSQGQFRSSDERLSSRLSAALATKLLENSDPVDGAQLLTQIKGVLKRYLYFKDKRQYLHLALWIMGTYLYSIFSYYGFLWNYSEKPQRGKTLKQQVTYHLAFESSRPVNAPTPASIRERASGGGTVQMDTLERWPGKDSYQAAMEILDAGFRNGGLVQLMVKDQLANRWVLKVYPVYAPYQLSGLHKNSLTDTALDRSFPIEMHKKSLWVQKNIYKEFICEGECQPIRDTLYTWALQNAAVVATIYGSSDLEGKVSQIHLNNRAADIWTPLFAVLQSLGFDQGSDQWDEMASLSKDMHADPEVMEINWQLAIVKALKDRANGDNRVVGMTSDFVDVLTNREINTDGLQQLLKEWGFEKKSKRLDEGPRNAWDIPVEDLDEIEHRLLEHLLPPETVTTTTTFQ